MRGNDKQNINEISLENVLLKIEQLSDFEIEELRQKLNAYDGFEFSIRARRGKTLFAIAFHTATLMFFSMAFITFSVYSFLFFTRGMFFHAFSDLLLFVIKFSLSVSIVFTLAQILAIYFLLPGATRKLLKQQNSCYFLEEMIVPLQCAEAVIVSHQALSLLKNVKIESVDPEKRTLKGNYGLSWKSPGEFVGIKIEPVDFNTSCLRIYSKGLCPGLDFGKNKQNVKEIAIKITETMNIQAFISE